MAEELVLPIDTSIAKKLMKQTGPVTDILPDDMKPDELHASLVSSLGLLGDIQASEGRLKTIIGRMLQLATSNPEVYKSQGMEHFEDYITFLKKRTGLSRTTLFDSRTLVKNWSNLPVEEIQEIGFTKLMIAGKHTNQEDPGYKKVLKMARESETADVFRDKVEQLYSAPGSTSGDKLTIVGSKADIKELRNWLEDAEVRAYLGTSKEAKMINFAFEGISADVQAAAKEAAKKFKGKKGEEAA
jgi:hypothetical protein